MEKYTHSEHHDLDIEPSPKEVLYINEDNYLNLEYELGLGKDNVRVYIPLDICESTILSFMVRMQLDYGDPCEKNEFSMRSDFSMARKMLEIYDQIWSVRETDGLTAEEHNAMLSAGKEIHSLRGIKIARKMADQLYSIAESSSAEMFPYDVIPDFCRQWGLDDIFERFIKEFGF